MSDKNKDANKDTNKETNNKFDLAKFNKEFTIQKEKKQRESKIKSQEKINKLNKDANIEIEPLYSLSISELLFGVKNTWFDILDDILAMKFNNIITKNNRLFYIGLTVIIVAIILYIYDFFLEGENK